MVRTKLLVTSVFALFAVTTQASEVAPDPNTPLIDFANTLLNRECPECPGNVGQMMGVNPIRLGEIKSKADIIVEDCHFTLVAPDVVRTASHCLRRWTKDWSTKAGGDCSKAYRFYFPKTREFPSQAFNCKKITSRISDKSGLLQMEPDDVEIQLDQSVARGTAAIDHSPITLTDQITIWGYDGANQAFQSRNCQRVDGSLLTPLDQIPEAAYATLTCDGSLGTGWSGAGVFVNGRLKGVVSFGLGQTTLGVSFFGENEVAISQSSCALSEDLPLANSCLPSAAHLNMALHDRYASAIDKAVDWQMETLELIRNRIPYVELNFQRGPQLYSAFSYTPQFVARCYHRSLLPESGQILKLANFNMDTFRPRYVVFAPDTTVAGVSRRNVERPQQSLGEFNIGLNFVMEDFSLLAEGVMIDQKLFPYCEP